jgi:hypothetical protein
MLKIQFKEPVDAIQYTGDNSAAIIELIGQYNIIEQSSILYITRGGQFITANVGDYIINMRGNPLVATEKYFKDNYAIVTLPEPVQQSSADTGLREVFPRGEGIISAEENKTLS